MKIINLIQGTPEWHAHRAQHHNASDAPAMMGCSPYKTRAQLLREVATGISQDVDPATQRRFDDGHRYEELARPLAEQIIGEELFPVTVTDGKLSASLDGLTMAGYIAFEHKTLNDELRRFFDAIDLIDADGKVPAEAVHEMMPLTYQVQMEQQLHVSRASSTLFMASKWNGNELLEERYCWYESNPELRAKIIAGWEQFEADVAAYVPEAAPAPVATGRAPEALPALTIQVTGMVTASNLAEFKASALSVLEGINRNLQNDDDFANAEQTVKWCKAVEDRIEATKDQVLGQTADIDAVFRTLDEVSGDTRRIRLELDRLVKAEKENRKVEIVQKARATYAVHEDALKTETNNVWINLPAPDFAGAIKGKRTLSSMQDEVDTVLANAKIAANESARHIRAALACLTQETEGHKHLFPDFRDFIAKPIDDIRALVRGRIAEHQQREAQLQEAERERIRAEEQAKLQREQQEEAARIEREQRAAAPQPVEQIPANVPVVGAAAPASAVTPVVAQVSAPPAVVASTARIKLGQINTAIAPLSITADGLASLGFQPVATERSAKLYASDDLQAICIVLGRIVAQAPAQLGQQEAA